MVRVPRPLRLTVLAIVILAPAAPLGAAATPGRRPAASEESMGRQQGAARVLSRLLMRLWGKPGAEVDPNGASVAGPTAPPLGQSQSEAGCSAGTDGSCRDDQ
jgi:hypothetical protein